MKQFKKKQLALSTLVALACVGHIGYAADSATATTPTTTTTENGVTNNYWDITINNIKEDSGLELGSNARARGNGSIATGTGSLAVGNNAVATGGNETKDTITGKLNENRQRLAEISTAQNAVTNLANEIQKIRAEQAKTIEAGERVKQVRLAKEKAHQDYLNKQNAWSTEVANSAEFLRNAQAKLDDLNNRLGAVNRLGGVDINSEDGLTAAATNLKRMTEEGSTLNLPLDSFYKEYIKAHYKAMGDLRNNQIILSKSWYAAFFRYSDSDDYSRNMNIKSPYNINMAFNIITGIEIRNRHLDFNNYGNYKTLSKDAFNLDNTLQDKPTKDITLKNINIDLSTKEEWDSSKEQAPKFKKTLREYFNNNNNPLFTQELKEKLYLEMDKKIDYFVKSIEITYYQKQYEDTHNTSWLDKKNVAIKEYNALGTSYNLSPILEGLKENYKNWEKLNITDIVEKNKITTNKLTSDLETALQINKNAVAEKEKQIAALKASADQAKTNWESINPSASDLLYMEQYEALMRQLTAKSQELQQNQERLTALKNALTLHDLTNVGENAMAIGTNSLSTGSNSIAIGTGTIVTGENSISIGKSSAVTGTKSIAVGVGHIVIGNNAGTFGDPNTIYGDNSYAFGNNNTIGDATTTHTVGTNTFVLGSNVTTKANNSVVLGKDSTATEDNVVSIGSATSTRKLVNVTDGTIAENSKEAINGNQLWKVAEAKDGAINKTAWQTALGTGTVTDGNTGLVTGGTVNTAITNAVNTATSNINNGLDSKFNAKANTALDNITDDGKTVIRNLSKEAVKLENGTNTSVESRVDGNSTIYKVNVSNDAITGAIAPKISELSNAVDTKLATKANKDASNLSTEDASKWSEKLGTGTVTDGNTGLVTGGTVNTAITNAVNTATSNINNGLDSKFNAKANTALDNITDDGKTVIRNLSKEAVKLENGTNTSVESRTDGNSTIYKVNVSNDAITGAIAPKITELSNAVDTKLATKANKDASNISTEDAKKWSEKLGTGTAKAGDKGLITGDTLHTALANVQIDPSTLTSKANTNASNLTAENVKEWSAKLGTGTVGQGESSNGLVNGKSVYEAIQNYSPKGLIKTDGKTVTVDRAGTATHVDFRGTDEHGNSILRDITGVVTNPNDPTSVVNMDTLQTQSQGLEQKLTKDINVGTATASALAALHPLDFDESNKVSFAVSHGQYNGAKATAFGGFVRPNENIMLSLASTISPNDRAWNAGLSFKIGSGSDYKKITKGEVNELRKKNDNLQNQLNQLKEQLSKLSTRLSPKRASFPDVPKNHWASEAVETLHGNDVLDGYPDGEFKGDKQMTRYEYAQMLYKGLK
ncbi:S-layer homology domain-containing protein [Veillonella sp. VA142]|uniref:S-layer homology domain-containing protein n=1 Tax=Veillonella sp. VA142 TaxID=741834 RepID=UPI000F8E1BF8|nr:S-layer homology domain-containing protein [Veillonella sp. VA142]